MFTHYSKDSQVISIMSLCFALRLTEKETIRKLDEEGYNFSRQTFYKIKKKLKNNLVDRVNDVYNFEMLQEHFLAITAIKEGQRRLWALADKEADPYKSAEIITQALNAYPFLSGYYLNIKKVMSQHKSIQIRKDIIPV
jgi:hypothetical protein